MIKNFFVNGAPASTDAPPDTPLLWVLREGLKLTGTKFGCGAGLCGACMVHIDGKRAFSCQTQVSEIAGKLVTTIEGLSPDSSHPVQKAWLAERVPQCGYCQSGQIMSAADLLKQNPKPSREQIVAHMSTNICRCGTYQRIVRAVERAARETLYEHAHTKNFDTGSASPDHDRRCRPFLRNCVRAWNVGSGNRDRARREIPHAMGQYRGGRDHHHHVGGDRDGAGLNDRAAADYRRGTRCRLGQGQNRTGAGERKNLRQSRFWRHDVHGRLQCGAKLLRQFAAVWRASAPCVARQCGTKTWC